MFERFTELARLAVVWAQEEARAFRAPALNGQHLLLGLVRLDGAVAARALDALDVTVERLQLKVARGGSWGGGEPTTDRLPFRPEVHQALKHAREEAQSLGHEDIGTEHILLGLTRVEPSWRWPVPAEFGASAEAVRREVLRLIAEDAKDPVPEATASRAATAAAASSRPASFAVELAQALERAQAAATRDGARAVDAGDLLLALAIDSHTLPGGALAHAGLDFGQLRRVIAALRELDRQIEAVRSERDAALEAQRFERVAQLRDEERSLVNRRHQPATPAPRDTG